MLPVVTKPRGSKGQHLAPQLSNPHPRKNEKTAVVYNLLQILAPLPIVPANPAIPRRHPPGRTGKLQTSHHRSPRLGNPNQVAQMSTKWHPVTKIVVTSHQLPPKQTLLFPFHQLQQNRSKIPHPPHKETLNIAPVGYWHRRPRTPRPTDSTLWKSEKTPHFQQLQKLSTLPSLQRTIRPAPVEQLAHRASQLHPTHPRTVLHYLPNARQLLRYKSTTARTLPSTTHHIHQTNHPFPVSYI